MRLVVVITLLIAFFVPVIIGLCSVLYDLVICDRLWTSDSDQREVFERSHSRDIES